MNEDEAAQMLDDLIDLVFQAHQLSLQYDLAELRGRLRTSQSVDFIFLAPPTYSRWHDHAEGLISVTRAIEALARLIDDESFAGLAVQRQLKKSHDLIEEAEAT